MFKNLLAAIVITDAMYHLPEARGFLAEAKQCSLRWSGHNARALGYLMVAVGVFKAAS